MGLEGDIKEIQKQARWHQIMTFIMPTLIPSPTKRYGGQNSSAERCTMREIKKSETFEVVRMTRAGTQ
eukprot:6459350-Amphidinium_carterae.1